MKFDFHADPGHGWLTVTRKMIHKLEIADKISAYSYQRGDKVYLEEDCDMTTFVQAAEAAGIKVEIKVNHTNKQSRFRGYQPYSVQA